MGLIYKITNLANGLVYIGLTQRTKQERFSEHCSTNAWHCQALHDDIVKYGKFRFSFEVLVENITDTRELASQERYWIKYYEAYKVSKGYNQSLGGEVNHYAHLSKQEREELFERLWDEDYYKQDIQTMLDKIEVYCEQWYADGRWSLTSVERARISKISRALRVGLSLEKLKMASSFLATLMPVFSFELSLGRSVAIRQSVVHLIHTGGFNFGSQPRAGDVLGRNRRSVHGKVVVVTKGKVVAEVDPS